MTTIERGPHEGKRGPRRTDPTIRFRRQLVEQDGCLVYTGAVNEAGYGKFTISPERTVYAHRYNWELERGAIPADKVMDHLCRNPRCVRIEHLEVVTVSQNTKRGILGYPMRTLCRAGLHDITDPANIYTYPNGIDRQCRACRRAARRAFWERTGR